MSEEQYREYIKKMVDEIDDGKSLRMIFGYVHGRFIRKGMHTGGKGGAA